MSSPRTSTADLARLLNTLSSPLYVVDDQRRIVFANGAAAEWAGFETRELIGQKCNYHSSEGSPAAVLAAALCPPPEVFHGQRVAGRITLPGTGPEKSRAAEFIPLGDEGQVSSAVLVLLAGDDSLHARPRPMTALNGEATALHDRLRRFRQALKLRSGVERLVGDSPAMKQARAQITLAAGSRTAVLIIGPQGSGRRDAARAIHYGGSSDGGGPIVPLSCAALGAELLQSTIAALVAKSTLRQSLDHGTLLLNDVEEAPAEVQAELVQLLVAPSGPRIIATAREPLARRVASGEFRDDLACALSTVVIQLPPLSQRRGDLPLAAQMFLEDLNAQGKKQLRGFAADALDALATYSWPGNLTELEQIVREAHAKAEGFEVTAADLPKRIRLSGEAQARPRRRDEPIHLEQFMAQVETELIRRALGRSKGNKSRAATLLGMTRPRLYRRMVQLGLVDSKPDA